MAIDKIFDGAAVDGIADNLFNSVSNSVSEIKAMQQRKAAENVQLVIQALKKIDNDIREKYDGVTTVIEKRVSTLKDGKDGQNGANGRDGKDGRNGKDGSVGPRGMDGARGMDGRDGEDGVSVADAHIDFDGSLIIGLSSGRSINVGEVVAPDLAEKIKVITNGGGTSQGVLDTLTSLQNQINLISSALVYKGTWNASTNTPALASGVGTANSFYIVSVAGTTTLDGISNWGVGDWATFNGTTWQRVEGGAAGNFTTLTASGVTTIQGLTVGRGGGALSSNAVLGVEALNNNTTGSQNTAVGYLALRYNITGFSNAANGYQSLFNNLGGNNNTAMGSASLQLNINGSQNTAIGFGALYFNTDGNYNTATGYGALSSTTASNNTASGAFAGYNNVTGEGNVFLGYFAGRFETGSNSFYVDNQNRTNTAGDKAGALLYGTFSATPASQTLKVNAALTATYDVTLSAGTANGVTYLNASKVLTTGSALTFDGSKLIVTGAAEYDPLRWKGAATARTGFLYSDDGGIGIGDTALLAGNNTYYNKTSNYIANYISGSEQMRLTSTSLYTASGINVGIGTSSPGYRLTAAGASTAGSVTALAIENPSTNAASEVRQEWRAGGSSWAYITTGYNSNSPFMAFGVSAASASPTERMRIDASGYVGIGTSSPIVKLQVRSVTDVNLGFREGQIDATAAQINAFNDSGSANIPIEFKGSRFIWNRSNVEAMRLDSSGNLGIGTSSPGARLEAASISNGAVVEVLRLSNNGSGANTQSQINFAVNTTSYATVTGGYGASAPQMTFNLPNATAGNFVWQNVSAETMRLDSSGNLLVGATSSTYSTSGRGVIEVNGSSNSLFALKRAGAGSAYLLASSGELQINNTEATPMTFYVNGSERARISSDGTFRVKGAGTAGSTDAFQVAGTAPADAARIDSSGNLLVGTTSAGSGSTSGKIKSVGNVGSINGIYSEQDTAGGYCFSGNAASNSGSYYFVNFLAAGTQTGSIVSNGTTTSYNITSDQRLKENIQDAAPASALIDSLQVRQYDWKSDGTHQRYGFIAQELVTVAPEAVHQPADPEEMMAVDYSKLVPMLVKEIQSLRQRLAAAGI